MGPIQPTPIFQTHRCCSTGDLARGLTADELDDYVSQVDSSYDTPDDEYYDEFCDDINARYNSEEYSSSDDEVRVATSEIEENLKWLSLDDATSNIDPLTEQRRSGLHRTKPLSEEEFKEMVKWLKDEKESLLKQEECLDKKTAASNEKPREGR